jgi:hypothetical protein
LRYHQEQHRIISRPKFFGIPPPVHHYNGAALVDGLMLHHSVRSVKVFSSRYHLIEYFITVTLRNWVPLKQSRAKALMTNKYTIQARSVIVMDPSGRWDTGLLLPCRSVFEPFRIKPASSGAELETVLH